MLKNFLLLFTLCLFCISCSNAKGSENFQVPKDKPDLMANTNKEAIMYPTENQYVILNNNRPMPLLGYGTWTFSNEEVEELAYLAIKNGYRLIDTAAYYGNEVGVGKAVRRAMQKGIITREDIFITSKIYASSDHNAAIERSLQNLNIGYIDLLLIHQPGFDDRGLYQAMEKYYQQGYLRAIGLSNYYTKETLDEVLSYAQIKPSVIQNENHIFYHDSDLQAYAKQHGIIIEAYYPLGGRGHTRDSLENKLIIQLAEKYHKTPAQIILKWQLQAGYIAIPGSGNPAHIKENINIFDFTLSEADMKKIHELNRNTRYENW